MREVNFGFSVERTLQTMRAIKLSEGEARALDICPACGSAKGMSGLVVCWGCFKHRADIEPLKYSGLGFAEWMRRLPADPGLDKLIGEKLLLLASGRRTFVTLQEAKDFCHLSDRSGEDILYLPEENVYLVEEPN